ncbi:hypothetical protein [Endozoicomonas lisbonensis]|uniref:Selenocysteine lyase/cysteine desulfurase n=1 Tax=Endozoicomonas lisbonensis TaxID=3120522 RepID=A0ABV2SGM9_9GAMM
MTETISKDEAQRIAKQAAHEAVSELLLRLGIDVNDADEIRSMQADLIYIRQQRKAAEQVGANVRRVALGAFVTGLISLVITGITQYFRQTG